MDSRGINLSGGELLFFFFLPLPDSLYIAVSRDDSVEKKVEEGGIFRHAVQFEVLFKVKKK